MTRRLFTVLLALLVCAIAVADGKFYARESVPPTVPYQRALIYYQDGTETLVLQSKYELPPGGIANSSIGWVVPVPTVPEVASMNADDARSLFGYLGFASHADVTRIRDTLGPLLLLGFACWTVFILLVALVSSARQFWPWFERHSKKLVASAGLSMLGAFSMCLFMPGLARSVGGTAGVELVSEHSVGVYDVRVVRSTTVDDLIAWLKENTFHFGEEDQAALGAYVARGWCFVAAHVRADAVRNRRELELEGMAAPLILRFAASEPTYPVALTATANAPAEILIYLVADSKMSCDGRLALRYAGHCQPGRVEAELCGQTDPKDFFAEGAFPSHYLCKFKDTLTPAQMAQDITFTKAADNMPFRERWTQW